MSVHEDHRVDEPDRSANPPDWWHREHPTFTSLTGFFTGMLAVTLVPGAFAGILRLLFTYDKAEQLFPWIAVLLVDRKSVV